MCSAVSESDLEREKEKNKLRKMFEDTENALKKFYGKNVRTYRCVSFNYLLYTIHPEYSGKYISTAPFYDFDICDDTWFDGSFDFEDIQDKHLGNSHTLLCIEEDKEKLLDYFCFLQRDALLGSYIKKKNLVFDGIERKIYFF